MRLASILFVALNLISQNIQSLPWINAPSRAVPQNMKINIEEDVLLPPSIAGSRRVEIYEDGTLVIVDQRNQIIWRGSLPGRRLRSWFGNGAPLPYEQLTNLRFPESIPERTVFSTIQDPRDDFHHLLWLIDDGENYLTCLNPVTLKIAYLKLPNIRDPRIRFVSRGILVSSSDKDWMISWIDLATEIKYLNTVTPLNPAGTAFKPFPNAESLGLKTTRTTPFEDRPKPKDE